jgi:hypothetical protein
MRWVCGCREGGIDEGLITAASRELQACFSVMAQLKDWNAAGLILEDIGVTKYARDDQIAEAESFLVAQAREVAGSRQATLLLLRGVTKGLEAALPAAGTVPDPTRRIVGVAPARAVRVAVKSGRRTHSPSGPDGPIKRRASHDTATLRAASLDGFWENRRIVAGSLEPGGPRAGQAR